MSVKPNKEAKRKTGVYRTYKNSKVELIALVTSPFEAIEIAAEHIGKIKGTIISIGSEREKVDADKRGIC